jgi:hypothetical protein
MSFLRYLSIPLLIGGALLLTGALGSQSASSSRFAAATATADHSAPAAARLLDQALAALDPSRLAWLETAVWQKGSLQGYDYVTEGRYLIAPNYRLRLELTTRYGQATVTQHAVSDGVTYWQGTRTGNGNWTNASRVDLKKVLSVLEGQQSPVYLREEFLREQSFGGVLPLLRGLRQQMAWLKVEKVRRNGRELFKLTGKWRDDVVASLAPPDKPWPDGLARHCRLYLDVSTLWPHRFEWWGQDSPHRADGLLVQMEFRDAVLNRPLSAERCSHEFSLPRARPDAHDRTAELIETLRGRR